MMQHAVENKISAIQKYLTILARYLHYSREEIERDVDIRGAVERYLYLATQATIDLAEALIAYKGFRKPTTMGEAFRILAEQGMITASLTERLVQMTGFRNVLAHDYEIVDYGIVHDTLHTGRKDIEEFLSAVNRLSHNPCL